MPINLCFISSRCANLEENNLWLDWSNGRLIKFLERRIPEFSLAVFIDPQRDHLKYDLNVTVKKVYALPFPYTYFGGLINTFKVNSIIRKIENENDLLIIQLPFISFFALRSLKKPVIYHLCANVLTASRNPTKYKGPRKILANFYAWMIHKVHQHLFSKNNNSLIVNGTELGQLYGKYNPLVVVSSSISKQEILVDKKNNNENNYSLLFIGRPSLEKGFDLLLKMCQDMRDIHQVNLTVIGFGQKELKK